MGWVFRRDAWSAHIFRQGHRWRRTRVVRVGVGVNRFTSCSPFARLGAGKPASGCLIDQALAPNSFGCRGFTGPVPPPLLMSGVYVDSKYSKPSRPSQDPSLFRRRRSSSQFGCTGMTFQSFDPCPGGSR